MSLVSANGPLSDMEIENAGGRYLSPKYGGRGGQAPDRQIDHCIEEDHSNGGGRASTMTLN